MTSNDVLSCSHHEGTVTKAMYRFKVWNLLENKDLVLFPRPCKGRIPNFVACNVAAEKLTSLEEFKKAKVIKVNMDKPQEPLRFSVLEEGKTLVVPVPSLVDGVVMKICPPENPTRAQLSNASGIRGSSTFRKPVSLEDNLHIDMVVIGSVAVSKEGHRIGKGEGFTDLEFALMVATGLVSEDTLIATTVHDEQVFDQLPQELFQPFDVPVDIIVTPTQVIRVSPSLPKPAGILWNLLSDRRLQRIPLLKTIRSSEIEAGKDCTLKEVDSEPEERPRPYFRSSFPPAPRRFMRQTRGRFNSRRNFNRGRGQSYYDRSASRTRQSKHYDRYGRNNSQSQESQRTNSPVTHAPRRTRTFFRRGGNRRRPMDGSGDTEVQVNGHDQDQKGKENYQRRNRSLERRGSNRGQERRGRNPNQGRKERNDSKERNGRDYSEENGKSGDSQDRSQQINGRDHSGERRRGRRDTSYEREERDQSEERDYSRERRGRYRSQEGRGRGRGRGSRGGRGGRMNRGISGENKENQTPQTKSRPYRSTSNRFRQNFTVDFSVKIGNIDSTMRVRELKDALIEKGVRPRDITWRGPKGFALLHFAKNKPEEEQQPIAVDDVIASLQNLTVKCKSEEEVSERQLSVEPAKPISRIEDAGVTAV